MTDIAVEHIHVGFVIAVHTADEGGVAVVDIDVHLAAFLEPVVQRVLVEAVQALLAAGVVWLGSISFVDDVSLEEQDAFLLMDGVDQDLAA